MKKGLAIPQTLDTTMIFYLPVACKLVSTCNQLATILKLNGIEKAPCGCMVLLFFF
nr:MAG TPA: hypothetical protein [Caudoviricetes sp.]